MEPAGKGNEATRLTEGRPDSRDDNAEDCPVCLTAFDDTVQRPRVLPCGHTFCTPCMNGLKEQGQVTCPTCRLTHAVPEAGQFPVSYVTESLIRRLRGAASACLPPRPGKDTADPVASLVTGAGQKEPVGLSRPIRSMVQEQEAKVLAAIHTCQEVQAQLDQYQTILVDWGERQQVLEDRLQALVDQSKAARVLLRQEESQVVAKKDQVKQGEQQLHTLLETLRMAATRLEACEAIENADLCTDEKSKRAEECQGMFPNMHTVTTITKVKQASCAALEAATIHQTAQETVDSAAGDPGFPASPDSSIRDRLVSLLTPTLAVEDLRSLRQLTRSLLQDGLVFVIHQEEGQSRHARISVQDDRLYLHCMQDQPLTSRAVTLQMDELVSATPPWSLVFLDLVWPGSAKRRVLICLNPDNPWGQEFLLLCTGQRGPCYANTRLLCVENKGMLGEYVIGGDYEHNDGSGGRAVIPDLGDEVENQISGQAGGVGWVSGDTAMGAQFYINTRDCLPGRGDSILGEVVSGLDVVAAAAQHDPIKEVTVADCGVVLWD